MTSKIKVKLDSDTNRSKNLQTELKQKNKQALASCLKESTSACGQRHHRVNPNLVLVVQSQNIVDCLYWSLQSQVRQDFKMEDIPVINN